MTSSFQIYLFLVDSRHAFAVLVPTANRSNATERRTGHFFSQFRILVKQQHFLANCLGIADWNDESLDAVSKEVFRTVITSRYDR